MYAIRNQVSKSILNDLPPQINILSTVCSRFTSPELFVLKMKTSLCLLYLQPWKILMKKKLCLPSVTAISNALLIDIL